MKILYLCQHFNTPDGAGGLRPYHFPAALVAAGHEVTLVCGSYSTASSGLSGPFRSGVRRGMVNGFEVIELNLAYGNAQSFARRVSTFLAYAIRSLRYSLFLRYDLVFASSTPLTVAIPGLAARWLRSKPFVFEVRDLWPELPREMGVITNKAVLGMMSLLKWAAYRSARQLVALAPGIAEGIERLGVAPERIAMIPNGSDLVLFRPLDVARRRAIRARYPQLGEQSFLAVYAGSHGIANGLDRLIDAAQVLKQRGNEHVQIVLVGEGRLKDDLVARAQSMGLSNCVFLPTVDKREIGRFMASCDVGLMSLANVPAFYRGTSPNKFFDYIACGLPVVNNYPGWLASLITVNECGIAVPPDDPGALADALETLAGDPVLCEQLSANSRRLAEAHFDWQVLQKRFVAVFDEFDQSLPRRREA